VEGSVEFHEYRHERHINANSTAITQECHVPMAKAEGDVSNCTPHQVRVEPTAVVARLGDG
jgi:hypothetical protein